MTPRCLCCGHTLDIETQFEGWCDDCASRALAALLDLRDGLPASVRARVAFLQDAGVPMLAKVVMGPLPFDGG